MARMVQNSEAINSPLGAARDFIAANNWEQAANTCQSFLQQNNSSAEAEYLLGLALSKSAEKQSEAANLLNKALQKGGLSAADDNSANLQLGILLFQSKQEKEADILFSKVKNWETIEVGERKDTNDHYPQFIMDHKSHALAKNSIEEHRTLNSFELMEHIPSNHYKWIGDSLNTCFDLIHQLKKVLKNINVDNLAPMYKLAVNNVPLFINQYPLTFYPIVAKSLELAFLQEQGHVIQNSNRICELAIGEGSFSARIFSQYGKSIDAFDLSPYSIKVAESKAHVDRAIVCDCMNPPIKAGSYDLLLSNNFLHHITDKVSVLNRFANIAEHCLFNENTPHWAFAFTHIKEYKNKGLYNVARYLAAKEMFNSAQTLLPQEQLDRCVLDAGFNIKAKASYLSEDVMNISKCTANFVMVPENLKLICSSDPFKPMIHATTGELAKLLIIYDSLQSRSTDSFVSYYCKSKQVLPPQENCTLNCPRCNGDLEQSKDHYSCSRCKTPYPIKNGIGFILEEKLSRITDEYDETINISAEHL
ncbi:MAG: hypothetical protein COB51_09165 [Moraxellaceae bacterium]|nr:MAG: hypothetical protein COB51_09165 [Moraxellaceae bacterium]